MSKIRNLGERVHSLEPNPRSQEPFSTQKLAGEMSETLDYLLETYGPGILTDQYGRDHSSEIQEAIRRLDSGSVDFDEDCQVAAARLIHAMDMKESSKAVGLRSTFRQAFEGKSA